MEIIPTPMDPASLLRVAAPAHSRGSLLTWCTLLLAAIATLGGLLRRARILIFDLRRCIHRSIPEISTVFPDIDDSDDDNDETCSSSSSDEEELTEEEAGDDNCPSHKGFWFTKEPESESDPFEFFDAQEVVKTWEADVASPSGCELKFASRWRNADPIFFACGDNLTVWDPRVGVRAPAMSAAWWSPGPRRRAVAVGARQGEEKLLYVTAKDGSTAEVDLRWGRNAVGVAAGRRRF